MPEQATIKRAHRDARQGKSASTQAGEFVHQEMDHIRKGKHGARSAKQAIAIGLSEARRAGVKVPRKKGTTAKKTGRKTTKRATTASRRKTGSTKKRLSPARSRASSAALKARRAFGSVPTRAVETGAQRREAPNRQPTLTGGEEGWTQPKGAAGRSAAARKAARTRARG